MFDSLQEDHDKSAQSSENHADFGDQTQPQPSSSLAKSTDDM
jgi:hypothetical protein